jgi:hypothetical protein
MKETETLEQWLERARVQEVDRNVLPREVAIEMLTRPKVTLGGRDRRMFRDAMAKHFTSILQEKPREVKLAFKLQHSTWAQLNKWNKRTLARYFAMQKNYSKAAEKVAAFADGSPQKHAGDKQLAAFAVIMGLCGEALGCIENEIEARAARATAADKISTEEVSV